MTKAERKFLRKILRSTRKFVVRWDRSFGEERMADDDDLGGYCGFASGRLMHELEEAGLGRLSEAVHGDGHVFVVYKKKYVLDATSCQFGGPKTLMRKLADYDVFRYAQDYNDKSQVTRTWRTTAREVRDWGPEVTYRGPLTERILLRRERKLDKHK